MVRMSLPHKRMSVRCEALNPDCLVSVSADSETGVLGHCRISCRGIYAEEDKVMLVKRVSKWSGKHHVLPIHVTQDQLDSWRSGALVQDAMPNLRPIEREFIATGITESELIQVYRDGSRESAILTPAEG